MVTEAKKKKKITGSLPGVNVTVHSGDPFLNMNQFNKDAEPIPAPIVTPGAVSGDASTATSLGGDSACCGLAEDMMYAARLDIDVELPPHIHTIDKSLTKALIKKVAPEEEFIVGYVTPVYFYKSLWDKFTLFKCTEMTGWTGEDYIEARADDRNSAARIALANKQTEIADNIASAGQDEDHFANDGGTHNDRNPLAKQITDYSARYTLVNKIVAQDKGETLLFYPVVGSRPRVTYYIDMKDGNGYMPCKREDLEPTIYKKVMELARKKDVKERYVNGCVDKVRSMLAIDAATIEAVTLDDESHYETRSRFDIYSGQGHHVWKPQVRALYLQQIYFIQTKDKTLGKKDKFTATEAVEVKVLDDTKKLTEKRETKRYYIRPQDIFCANKADVLKGLIEVANSGENCTVYSLKNLSDHDDVHKLTNNDIIYYYDDNVLYDKNHVLVMDYDLFIKHEEERKKINKDPVALTKQDYAQHYGDRMTKETVVEAASKPNNITESMYDSTAIPFEAFKLAIEREEEVDLGDNQDDADIMFVRDGNDAEAYAYTSYVAGKDNDGYYIAYTINGDDGAIGDSGTKYYQSFDELVNAIQAKDWSTGTLLVELPEEADANPFNQTFESYDVFGNKLLTEAKEEKETCCICGEEIDGYGNNAEPYKTGKCCDGCNIKFVIPARLNYRETSEKAEAEE